MSGYEGEACRQAGRQAGIQTDRRTVSPLYIQYMNLLQKKLIKICGS